MPIMGLDKDHDPQIKELHAVLSHPDTPKAFCYSEKKKALYPQGYLIWHLKSLEVLHLKLYFSLA